MALQIRQTALGSGYKAPHDVGTLGDFFDHDITQLLTFSHDTWLPELQTAFLALATAIRREDHREVRFVTHRIRGCAAMGGAHDIVSNMRELDTLAVCGQWLTVRSRFRDANYLLRNINEWVQLEYSHIAS